MKINSLYKLAIVIALSIFIVSCEKSPLEEETYKKNKNVVFVKVEAISTSDQIASSEIKMIYY